MIEIHGYGDFDLLQQSGLTEVHRGRRLSDGTPVLVKTPSPGRSKAKSIQTLKSEYDLLQKFNIPGLAKPLDFVLIQKSAFLVLQDPGGMLMKKYIAARGADRDRKFISEFIDLAMQILDILDSLHKNEIIHKNINPDNFLIDPVSGSASLIDMSLASILPRENPQIQSPRIMEGALAYISPEQTGRMNRPLDYRTDFYSLGATLYEYLTGAPPFQHADPLELVHGHLAQTSKPPHELNPAVPRILSEIVTKLLAKTAEERYQSASGIKADLYQCSRLVDEQGSIPSFSLGEKDIPEKFRISSKLYGRDEESAFLLERFEKACRGPMEIVMIAGYSGIGKTSLVQETYKPITAKRGYYITGKFDRFHQNVPYGALVRAFQGLIGQILTESAGRLDMWRESLMAALGENARIVIDVIPDLELIIGPQPPVRELGSLESQNRFNRVFKNFIRVFCRPAHPLVIFLDDLQWVDMATLRLLEFMVSGDRIEYLFGIGAYRDNEVGPAHPLQDFLNLVGGRGDVLNRISVKALKLEHVTNMISETLSRKKKTVRPLARLVFEKTYGNPFFINQFLTTLNQERLLSFDAEKGGWVWDDDAIRAMSITDNVVDLLIRRLKAMPSETRSSLETAACLGVRFDLDLLSLLTGRYPNEVFAGLLPALREGLIVPAPGPQIIQNGDQTEDQPGAYRFLHDRVHQAAYALIGDKAKRSYHLNIGRVLLEILDENRREEHLFDILDHLNFAADLIDNDRERIEIALLNLKSGRKALASSAFQPAFTYLKAGIEFLGDDSWESDYKLTLDLYTECLKAAHLSGRYAEMEGLFEAVREMSLTPLDRAAAYESRILALDAQNLLPQSLESGLEILAELGEPIPTNLNLEEVKRIFMETARLISGFSEEDLIDGPLMSDPEKLAVTGILGSMIATAFIGLPELSPLVVCRIIELTLSHGHTPESPFAFAAFGAMLCKFGQNIEAGRHFGEMSRILAERNGSHEQKTKVLHAITGYVDPWTRHLAETLDDAARGRQSGLESGSYDFVGFNTYVHGKHSMLSGRPLHEAEREMAANSEAVRHLKQEVPLGFNNIYLQTVQNLLGRSDHPTRLIGNAYDERVMLPRHSLANDRLSIYYYNVCRLLLCFLFEEYEAAVAHAEAAQNEIDRSPGGPADYPLKVFLGAMAQLALAHDATEDGRRDAVAMTLENQELLKVWSVRAPMNYLHKFHLVAGERACLLGEDAKALEHFDLALAHARESGYVNDEALVLDLTGKFFLRFGRREMASGYFRKARQGYRQWEALRKVRHLEENYAELLNRTTVKAHTPGFYGPDAGAAVSPVSSGQLDLATLMKASQAIVGELDLDRLLIKLIRTVIENAGADAGALVLESEGRLHSAVRGTVNGAEILLKPYTPIDEDEQISSGVIHYVARTRKIIVLTDPAEQAAYANDEYLQSAKPRSVLSAPVIHQTRLIGILYLENTRIPDAFPPDRLEVLDLLASRIAAALENARLYEELKQTEEKYRSIFENAVEGIYRTTPDGRFIDINPSAARLLGYETPEEAMIDIRDIGRQIYVNEEDRLEFVNRLKKREFVFGFEAPMYQKNGKIMWVSINARPVLDGDGELSIIEGFITDVTERKQATDHLIEREEYLRKENIILRSSMKDRYRFGRMIGRSPEMQEVYELIVKAAASEANVIIYGESGTGKDLAARAIHEMSNRGEKPFVPVNCGAIPENLMESEFFGYKKGAFTGAEQDRAGHLETADQGILFLDELGEISPSLQVKLLRVLEGGGFTPLGDRETRTPDVRIIAATNRDLQEELKGGRIREDFFYRIHVIPIHMPPLRKRREDIPLLIEHFLSLHADGESPPKIPGHVLDAMLAHDWPGNVRELQNTLHRYITLNRLDFLWLGPTPPLPEQAGPDIVMERTGAKPLKEAMAEFEKKYILRLLEENRWRRGRVAKILGVDRKTLYRRLEKHGL